MKFIKSVLLPVLYGLLFVLHVSPSVMANEEDFAPIDSLTLTLKASCRKPYGSTSVTATTSPALKLELNSAAGKIAIEPKILTSITAPQLGAIRLTEGTSFAGAATLHVYIPFGSPVSESGNRFSQLVMSIEGDKLTRLGVITPTGIHDSRTEELPK